MSEYIIKLSVTIARDSSDTINIRFFDEASRIEFARAQLSLEDYARVLTGQAHIRAIGSVNGLAHVGKRKIVEKRSIMCPIGIGRDECEAWLAEHGQEPGWFVSTYLGSQGSRTRNSDNQTVLNYSVFRYEDVNDESDT